MKRFNPQSEFEKPVLWKYYPDRSRKIWAAQNYRDYIRPYNDLVEYFINSIEFFISRGIINIKFRDGGLVKFRYSRDTARLCKEAGQGEDCDELHDFWQNPNYYIWNLFEGDCEDYALLWGSVFERLEIPYRIVSGFANGARDWWIEFVLRSRVYLGQVNMFDGMPSPVDHRIFVPYEMFSRSVEIQPYRKWYL